MPVCKLCNVDKPTAEFVDNEICARCAAIHALPPPSPPLRPRVPCARCKGISFVRCQVLRERAATGGDHSAAYTAPLAATFGHTVAETFWARRQSFIPGHSLPLGVFEAYVCRLCGFTELYARDAGLIPIGREYATELFEVEGEAPYR